MREEEENGFPTRMKCRKAGVSRSSQADMPDVLDTEE